MRDWLQNIQRMLEARTQPDDGVSGNWMQNIRSVLGANSNAAMNAARRVNWGELLGPTALGGLAGALMSSQSAKKLMGNVLLMGGGAAAGAYAWDRYKKYMEQNASDPQERQAQASVAPAPSGERARRLILALVFAAKADGHIDAAEHQAIRKKLAELEVGSDMERLIEEAINKPLDPEQIAKDVRDREEALEIYLLSRSVINLDHFMERSYLDALAKALKIPDEARQAIEADMQAK